MYCKNCGNQVDDNAVICTKCGCLTDNGVAFQQQVQNNQPSQNQVQQPKPQAASNNNSLGTAAKILMIISTVITGLYILPLLWMLPLTLVLSRKLKNNEPISTGFKICILLFGNTIAGILLFCMKEN